MSLKFIDPTLCEIDGKKMLYFKHPAQIIDEVQDALIKIGPEQLFRSPTQEVKQKRESMALLFFLLALQKETNRDWFFLQPLEDPPDFILASFSDNPINIDFQEVELVEIPVRCQKFEDVMEIVNKKLTNGYPSSYNLLIFINNEKSKEWLPLLNSELKAKGSIPFRTVWTVHLLFFKEEAGLWGSVASRLWPQPPKQVEAKLGDVSMSYATGVPPFMESSVIDGKTLISFKKDFVRQLRLKLLEWKNKNSSPN